MTISDLLLLCARKIPLEALRKSAFRKYCRRNKERPVTARCAGGFSMKTIIGDSVDNNIAVYGIFEVGTTHAIETLATQCDSLLDVGCNIGYYACLFNAGNAGKRLIAVDPNPVMTSRTRDNLELNGCVNFEILNCGLGSQPGELELHVPRDRHSLSSFAYVPKKGGPSHTIRCPIRPMHDVIIEQDLHNILVKIDTEGFECEVFRGLTTESTGRIRFMLFELASANLEQAGSSAAEIFALGVLQGFDAYVIQDEAGGYIERVDPARFSQGGRVNANVLLVKRDAETAEALKRSGVRIR